MTDLSMTDLSMTDLSMTDLSMADLSMTDLSMTDLSEGELKANATGVGVKSKRANEPSSDWLLHTKADALPYLAVLPWVTSIQPAISWQNDLGVSPEVRRRIDPLLANVLSKIGTNRPFAVGGVGRSQGCLQDEQRDAIRELGVVLMSVISHPSCNDTLFTYRAPINAVLELAALPWIVRLGGAQPVNHTTTSRN